MNILLVYPEFPDTFWSFKHALKKEVTEAISLSKDSIIQTVSESKDRVVAAVG